MSVPLRKHYCSVSPHFRIKCSSWTYLTLRGHQLNLLRSCYLCVLLTSGSLLLMCSIASFVQAQMVSLIVTLIFVFQLVSEKKIDKNLLPPKKIIGKNSKSLVEKRQKELEIYLQTLLIKFPVTAPKILSHFLHFHLYVSYISSM